MISTEFIHQRYLLIFSFMPNTSVPECHLISSLFRPTRNWELFHFFSIFTILKVLIKVFFFILETKQAIISFPSLPFSHYHYYSPFPPTSPIYSLERVIPPMGSLQSLRNQVEEGPSPHDPRCIVSEKVYDCDNKSNFGERKVIVTRKKKT